MRTSSEIRADIDSLVDTLSPGYDYEWDSETGDEVRVEVMPDMDRFKSRLNELLDEYTQATRAGLETLVLEVYRYSMEPSDEWRDKAEKELGEKAQLR